MVDEWSVDSVGDFFDLVTGYAFKSSDFSNDGIPVIKIKNVKAGHFSKHEFSYISPDFLNTQSDKIALADDLLISMSGNRHDGSPETWVGKVALFREEDTYLINQRVGALRLKKNAGLDARFASFLLSSYPYQELFISIATSSGGQANLSPQQILNAPVRYPEIGEQRAIAHILGTLDDKIELNRRMNETLEAMARALFKSWFIDFDPVRAKMAGRDPGLPQHLADLFPDRLVDSELGPIPEGWEVGCLDDIATAPQRSVDPAGLCRETPYIGLEHMPRRSIALNEWEGADKVTSNKLAFRKGEILFGKLRPYFHKVGVAPVSGVCSTDIVVTTSKTVEWSAFVLVCVSSTAFVAYTDQTSTGTKMPRTSWKTMSGYPLYLPSSSVVRAFQNAAQPYLDRIIANICQSRTLAAMRDTLLPKLISGEIRIRKADIQMETSV